MKNIGDFLSKFKIIRNPKQNREELVKLIKEITSIEIPEGDIKLTNKILFIQTHPALKNAIFIKKDIVLEKIKEKLPDIQVVDLK